MLNHARTLLMNVKGTSIPYDVPGEELVQDDYSPVMLPAALQNCRRILFGADPDRYMLNYRCKQLLGVIHATELGEFVLSLDSRISYDISEDVYSSNNVFFGSQIAPQGLATRPLMLVGSPSPPDQLGRMQQSWLVQVVSSNQVLITTDGVAQQFSYSMIAGLSSEVALPNSSLRVRFSETTGASWRVSVITRPQLDVAQLLANLDLTSQEDIVAIFQQDNADGVSEPFKTFFNLWSRHHELPYRLGGFLLALIYSTEKLR